jgi:hypothetical protein
VSATLLVLAAFLLLDAAPGPRAPEATVTTLPAAVSAVAAPTSAAAPQPAPPPGPALAAPAPLVVHLPEGARATAVIDGGVICGSAGDGWSIEPDLRSVRPPGEGAAGSRTLALRIASGREACSASKDALLLVATGPIPEIDPAGTALFLDEGRIEVRGQRLKGLVLAWRAGERSGVETCIEPSVTGKQQQCSLPLQRGLPADVALTWLPARGRPSERVVVFGSLGTRVDPGAFVLRPARVVLGRVVAATATADLSQGVGRVPLQIPGSVAAVDCGQARCEIDDAAIIVRSVPALASSLSARVRLAPRFFIARGDALETQTTLTLPVVHCPLSLASGAPLRDADDAFAVVRMDPRCKEARPRWLVNGDVADVEKYVKGADATFVLLRTGRLLGERLVVTAVRTDLDGSIIGQVAAATVAAPRPRASLELPQHGKVDFIPSNRDAVLTVGQLEGRGRLVPLPVEGAYTIARSGAQTLVRGDENSGGFVTLRFGYRVDGLPPEFAGTDLAILSERVQRQVREASVPAPFSTSALSSAPLIELQCADRNGNLQSLPPGKPHRLPLSARDTCRVIVHRERLSATDGTQEIVLEVDVTRAEGGKRGEAGLNERMVLRPGAEPRLIPLRGGLEEFDRVLVRVSHVVDESRYVLSVVGRTSLPAAQWSVQVEGGRLRLYATASIPAGLYRLNNPTGQLTLNFGVLSRLAYLDREGRESLFGAELGLMGMGLIQRPGSLEYPSTLGAIAGFGVRVPLGAGAAVGIHIWGVYEWRDEINYEVDARGRAIDCMGTTAAARGCRQASRFALVFGPSISIGNVGKNL